jgi:hypothetical protein
MTVTRRAYSLTIREQNQFAGSACRDDPETALRHHTSL